MVAHCFILEWYSLFYPGVVPTVCPGVVSTVCHGVVMELYPLFYLGVVPTVLSWSCIHCFILELYPLFYFGVVFTVCHGVVSWSFILFTVFSSIFLVPFMGTCTLIELFPLFPVLVFSSKHTFILFKVP